MGSRYLSGLFISISIVSLNACTAAGVSYDQEPASDFDASAPMVPVPQAHPVDKPQPRAAELSGGPVCLSVPTEQPGSASAEQPAPQQDPDVGACPEEMVLVEGDHCQKVVQPCKEWMEDPIQNPYARCRVFEEPSTCKGDRLPLRFCIDRLEAAGDDGLPLADKSWTEAQNLCEEQGKRLCRETEWLFACEGEEARPYPYGFVRSPELCNFERTEDLVSNKGNLVDHRQPATANPHCVSPFGVQNMVGNIDEWVVLDTSYYSAKNGWKKMNSGLKGGWWGPLRNRCRPTTVDHDEVYHALQTGFRCCKDAM